MTREFHPSVITLDIFLPDMHGWRILDRLKTDAATRHIPICVVSTDDARERALQAGAAGFLAKPLQSKDAVDVAVAELFRQSEPGLRSVLVVMPPSSLRSEFAAGAEGDLRLVLVDDGAAARDALKRETVDAVVVAEQVHDFGPEDVLEAIEARPGVCTLPVVVVRPVDGSAGPGFAAWQRRQAGFALREAQSLDELLAQSALVLHRHPSVMSERERTAVDQLFGARLRLAGKKALIVDDDMRNIFALATVLDNEGMVIVSAGNGREAIRLVEGDPEIDIVLMDIMMPELDDIATMQEIRKLPRGRELPMVAVTAKAMKGDRQKCIEAGAWDYLSKPVDPMHLLAVLRGWLCR